MTRAEELAKEIAELANECCTRSDGYEEDIAAKTKAALGKYGEEVRERCAQEADGEGLPALAEQIRKMVLP
jgi:hypothetical protein